MIIEFNRLPQSVLNQIPISLRINKTQINYLSLPTNLQIELSQYANTQYVKPNDLNILDFTATLGEYGDWFELTNLKDTILEYIRNWFKTPYGSYPFDPEFGSRIKTYLHTKDTALRKQLLHNEMGVIEDLVNNTYPSSFTITSSEITPREFPDRVEYQLNMDIMLLNNPLSMTITP